MQRWIATEGKSRELAIHTNQDLKDGRGKGHFSDFSEFSGFSSFRAFKGFDRFGRFDKSWRLAFLALIV
jgi:hypothetical protein